MEKNHNLSPWPASEPATQQASVREPVSSFAPADAGALGGRVVKFILGRPTAGPGGPAMVSWGIEEYFDDHSPRIVLARATISGGVA